MLGKRLFITQDHFDLVFITLGEGRFGVDLGPFSLVLFLVDYLLPVLSEQLLVSNRRIGQQVELFSHQMIYFEEQWYHAMIWQ